MKHIYMIGIKGVGMTSLALVYHRMGYTVSGSDVAKKFITDDVLHKYGITVYEGFDAAHIPQDVDWIVVSGPHAQPENAEYQLAIEKKVQILTHAEALGAVMDEAKLKISVCGSHGKTTASAMLATIFAGSDLKGAHAIGVPSFSQLDGGAYFGSDYFIAEADEYANNPRNDPRPRFSFQHPHIALCTNIDFDHPDIYSSLADVQNAFLGFLVAIASHGGKVVYNGDDKGMTPVIKDLPFESTYSYGTAALSDLHILEVTDDESVTTFKAVFKDEDLGSFELSVHGMHNIYNAAGSILVAHLAGIDMETVRKNLKNFSGSKRRMELIYQKGTTHLFDDYAHHPKEISAVVGSLRHTFPGKKLHLIFQPHTYSRTEVLAEDFKKALSEADYLYIMEVFGSEREKVGEHVQTKDLLGQSLTKEATLELLKKNYSDGDIVITMGAGNVYELHNDIKAILESL